MVKPIVLILAAIPILAAIFIVVPQLTRPEIQSAVVNSEDVMAIQYTKEHLQKISFGMTQSIGADTAEVLTIQSDGSATYSLTKNGYSNPDVKYQLSKDEFTKLESLIKTTGFVGIPDTVYQVKPDAANYEKYGLHVTLDGKTVNLQWADQNASQDFIPPIITQVQSSLDDIVSEIK
ncbi:MAG: hypothetical protein KGH88_01830 [Thaumarchaeota archaeon]|nr:hypothetical protein [Nitrososphaerota archaeon]